MIAVIGDSEQTASVALHAALGFAYIGTFPNVGFKFGRWLDTVLMQRALGGSVRPHPVRGRPVYDGWGGRMLRDASLARRSSA